jgi:hypothetical protein
MAWGNNGFDSLILSCRSNKGEPKQLKLLIECNLLTFTETYDMDQSNHLRIRINKWLQESKNASKRRDWGIRACCTCLQPQIISDYDHPFPDCKIGFRGVT